MLIWTVASTSKATEIEFDIQFILSTIYDFGVNEVQDILDIPNTGPIVLPLNFIEASIPPIILIARVDLPIAARDGEMGIFQGHLVEIVMEELKDEAIIETELIDAFADGDVVFGRVGEDGGDELDLACHLHLSNFNLKIVDFHLSL